ncbi:MAG: flagellar basal body-associated FliL family protein [Planctomycetota bacterium]
MKVVFSLQVAENHRGDVESLIEGKKAILKNWLISHLADKSLDDIKGKFGHSRLRREISEYFNQQLFEDGVERIQDILFKELNVQ